MQNNKQQFPGTLQAPQPPKPGMAATLAAMRSAQLPQNTAEQRVIESSKDIPEGALLTRSGGEFNIHDEWRNSFAVIRSGNVHFLIVAAPAFGSAQMFEMRRRMGQMQYTNVHILRAPGEIIKVIYSDRSDTQQFLDGGSTNVEDAAQEIISAAAARRSSDIHIEARRRTANVFFRVNGQRQFYAEISFDMAESIGRTLYAVHADSASKDTTWDPTQVVDGAIEWITSANENFQLRFSSSPIHPQGGFQIVIRLLSMDAKPVSAEWLGELGYTKTHCRLLDIMSAGSSGILIMCGPTNSGKSTSLQALLNNIYAKRGDTIKIITVEDPVEYVVPGACQISVARKRKMNIDQHTGSAFTTFLRGTLRQDPDVVMVGEIRDHDSASVVKDLVLAGRKMLTTLHTYSAITAFMRLREIGIPWEILTMPGFVAGVVYQRLVSTLCKHCSIPLANGVSRLSRELLHRIQLVSDLSVDDIRVRGDGCEHCNHTGISGRTVCAEFILPDHTFLGHLASGNMLAAEKYWREMGIANINGGGVTALAHAISKMRRGELSPVDVEDQIGLLTADMVNADNIITGTEVHALAGTGAEANEK